MSAADVTAGYRAGTRRWVGRVGMTACLAAGVAPAAAWGVLVGRKAHVMGTVRQTLAVAAMYRGEVGVARTRNIGWTIPPEARVVTSPGPPLSSTLAHHRGGFGWDRRYPGVVPGVALVVPMWVPVGVATAAAVGLKRLARPPRPTGFRSAGQPQVAKRPRSSARLVTPLIFPAGARQSLRPTVV